LLPAWTDTLWDSNIARAVSSTAQAKACTSTRLCNQLTEPPASQAIQDSRKMPGKKTLTSQGFALKCFWESLHLGLGEIRKSRVSQYCQTCAAKRLARGGPLICTIRQKGGARCSGLRLSFLSCSCSHFISDTTSAFSNPTWKNSASRSRNVSPSRKTDSGWRLTSFYQNRFRINMTTSNVQ
jgi:hypothetical protein